MNTPDTIMKMYQEIHELEQEAKRVKLNSYYIKLWKRSSIIQLQSCKRHLNNKSEFNYEFANFNMCMSIMSSNLINM
jgi:hypothetical protein